MTPITVSVPGLEGGIAGRLVQAAGSIGAARAGAASAQGGASGCAEPVAGAYASMHAAILEALAVVEDSASALARAVREAGLVYAGTDSAAMQARA